MNTPSNSKVDIYILAAGASRRMPNRIKQLLPWNNSTLLEHTIQEARKVTPSVHVILGAYEKEIRNHLENDIPFISNPNWEAGMGTSISLAATVWLAKKDRGEGLFFLVSDQPFIDAAHLNLIVNLFLKEHHSFVATEYSEKWGVPAIFNTALAKELLALGTDYGARHLIKKHKADAKAISAEGKEVDIDTWEKYEELHDK